jgi:3',5'-cyclic AMP phosphodiesterase CpdA
MPGHDGSRTIAHISDIHCGGPDFVPSLMERAVAEINELEPDLIICSGDLTTFGFKQEYLMAREYLDRLNCDRMVVIPSSSRAITTRVTSGTSISRSSSASGTPFCGWTR